MSHGGMFIQIQKLSVPIRGSSGAALLGLLQLQLRLTLLLDSKTVVL
jgi:hypothetical protein